MSSSSVVLGDERERTARLGAWFEQLLVLTSSDLRSRYGRGRWQLVKWLIDPFALVGVYLLMDTFIFYRRPYAAGLSLACSVIPFQMITMTVQSSLDAVRQRGAILGNMRFRRVLLPFSTALTEACGFAGSLTLLALMIAVYRVAPSAQILWLPVGLVLTLLLGITVAYPVTLIGVWAPDMRGLMMSAVRAAYYLAPGFVTLSTIHGRTQTWVKVNPLTSLFELLRHAVLYRSAPPLWELLVPAGWIIALLLLFVPIYNREQRHFAKLLE